MKPLGGVRKKAKGRSSSGLGMAAFSMLHGPVRGDRGCRPRHSVANLAALTRGVRQSNPENNSMFLLERTPGRDQLLVAS